MNRAMFVSIVIKYLQGFDTHNVVLVGSSLITPRPILERCRRFHIIESSIPQDRASKSSPETVKEDKRSKHVDGNE